MQSISTRRISSMQEVRPVADYAPPAFTYLCKECGGQATSYHAHISVSRFVTGKKDAIEVKGEGLGSWRCHACGKRVKVSRHAA